jgi:HlyD family secretion protein
MLDSFRRHPLPWTTGSAVAVLAAAVALRTLRPVPVDTLSLESRDIERMLVLVGRVRPPSRAALGASIGGTVRAVAVREGDRVSAGEVLVRLEDREARAAVAEAEAALAETRATARSTLEQAQREAEQAERDLARIRAVSVEGGLTRQQVELAEQRAADARSRLEVARAGVAGPGGRSAGEERARAALESARARLALTRVEAPADGVVLARSVEPGDAVQPGRALLEVAFDGPLELVAFPSEENLAGLAVGSPARASADAYPDQPFDATVSLIVPAVDPAQGTVEVRLAVPDAPDYLLPSMTVSVNIEAGRREGASVLPEEAVRGLGTSSPWVGVVRDGRLERQTVEVGLRAERWVEILAGLEKDDAVVAPDGSPAVGARVRAR